MIRKYDRKLVLENGTEITGYSFGAAGDKVLELVFNTSMVGYQEIISDPSYTDQAVVMTYPLIGNYGMSDEDYESKRPSIGALIVREYNDEPSSWRSDKTLGEVMEQFGIAGISGVDTRRLTRIIRETGSCKVLLTGSDRPLAEAVEYLKNTELRRDQVSRVSVKESYISEAPDDIGSAGADNTAGNGRIFNVVAIDCGMKLNIVRELNAHGCRVTVVPYDTAAEDIEALNPDGIFISNGPGDPMDAVPVIEAVKKLKGRYPMFGICLGHQIISLAYGARTYKLKFGHRGGNHPVMDTATGKIEMTSQNHSYAVDPDSLKDTGLTVTHVNLLDDTVEGMECVKDRVFSVQYHPESAPGPCDSGYLFDRFTGLMSRTVAEESTANVRSMKCLKTHRSKE
ncbi:MAG: glutamine-hydrolyzing carbamoyl-phosphate synthase small subunit [Lachnospiraceae bacterium]|nr:glutamine-hydrolyzing carbamoyl-phosphate synthase small subunit [Lachnospiraceae bacterium]